MKILYIDIISPIGHINFNKIQINTLISLNIKVHCIFKDNYFEELSIRQAYNELSIPKHKYPLYSNKKKYRLLYRYYYIRIYKYIKKNIDIQTFDWIIFGSYEPISLFFARINHKAYLFDHNNISKFCNPIYLLFTKMLSNKYIHIAFNIYIQNELKKFKLKNILIPHGLNNKYEINKINCYIYFKHLGVDIDKFKYKILCFATNNHNFIKKLIHNIDFINYINKNNILFIIKNFQHENSHNIIFLNNRLDINTYKSIFTTCDIIILPYKQNFKYRVSGVLFECIANDKRCLINKIPALDVYTYHFTYNCIFDTINTLISTIKNALNTPEPYYKNKHLLKPDYYWEQNIKKYD